MAWLEHDQDRNGRSRFHLCFRYGGKRFKGALGTTQKGEAQAVRGGAEKLLHQLQNGLRPLPPGTDLVAFVLSGGELPSVAAPARLTLKRLFRQYLRQLPPGTMEANSLYTVKLHLRHFLRRLGRKFLAQGLSTETLQGYVNKRLRMRGLRGGTLSPATVKKELTTLHGVWSWALVAGRVQQPFPKGLRFPKLAERPSFQTMDEIKKAIGGGGLTGRQERELWDCLFLTLDETAAFLEHVRATSRQGFLHPMLVAAAHTGARRSELLRSLAGDFDFAANTVTLREKKRAKGRTTTRRVPMSPPLRDVMRQWLTVEHPGGPAAFCLGAEVGGSRKRRPAPLPLTEDEAHDHLRRTLRGSKWEPLRGFHVLRHSFISNMAAANVDQRLIDHWVGHTSEGTRRRYRHLVPDVSQRTLAAVLGQQPVLLEAQ